MKKRPTFAQMKDWYTQMWGAMKIASPRVVQIRGIANRILAYRERYRKVADVVKLPWFWIACLHYRESNLNFHCHLHNGDPLTERTRHVPANRPVNGNPPFTWEESAIDALTDRGVPKIADVASFAYASEDYNGWGYYDDGVSSSYLWAWSDQHLKGKFVADHKYDKEAADRQCGVMPLLNTLMSLDTSIRLDQGELPAAPVVVEAPVHPAWSSLAQRWLKTILGCLSFLLYQAW